MKSALRIVVGFVLGSTTLLFGQISPNLDNGWKPFGSYDGSHLDTVNLMNGNLMLHLPLVPDVPQRGAVNMGDVLYTTSKDWQASCTTLPSGKLGCSWKHGATQFQVQPTVGLSVQRMIDTVYVLGTLEAQSAFSYTLVTNDGASHGLQGVVGSEDQNGIPTKYDTFDLTGYHLEMSNPDANGVPGTFTVIDRHGVQYQSDLFKQPYCGKFPSTNRLPQSGEYASMIDDSSNGGQTCQQFAYATLVTDSNGNQMNLTPYLSSSAMRDTLGRVGQLFVSGPVFNGTDATGCVSSHPFASSVVLYYIDPNGVTQPIKECFSNINLQTAFNQVSPYGGSVSEFNSAVSGPWGVLTTVILADGTTWTFDYDSYGKLIFVGLPTGGSITYTWTTINFASCDPGNPTQVSRAVVTRTLNDGQGHTQKWSYNWGTATSSGLTNIVTDPLSNDTVHIFTQQTPAGGNPPPGCFLYETSTIDYQGSQSANHPLQRVDTTYNSSAFTSSTGSPAVGNVFATDIVTTVYPSGKVKKVHRDPDTGLGAGKSIFGNVKKQLEYDWGQGAPGALLRETDTTYEWEVNSAYLTAHLLDLPYSVVVKDGNGNRVAETDYSYDEASYLTAANITTQHVAPPYGVRGNLSTVSRWLNTTNSSILNHTNWYDTGEVFQEIDPLGHQTTHSYDPAYAGAYPTQSCSPTTGSVTHCVSGTYDFNTGVLTSLTNENATTQASGTTQGDSAHTSNYGYDLMFRLTLAQAPPDPANGNLRAQNVFNFSPPNTFPVNVQRVRSVTTTLTDSTTNNYDGLGRVFKTQHALPNGTAMVDTTFDLGGHVATVSNPYFTTNDPTYGVTTNQYDALDRVAQTTKQDGSISKTQYSVVTTIAVNGDCAISIDEAGKQRGACTDGLGRLVEVDEPNSAVTVHVNNYATMQTDGNFVLYNPANLQLWSTGTGGIANAQNIIMQDDGNLVVYIFRWQAGVYAAPTAGPYPTQACGSVNYLAAGQRINANQCLVSPHGQYILYMRPDGNFYIYDIAHNTAPWGANTYGNPGAYATMQTDGNFVVYSSGGVALWNSGTAGTGAERLELEDDGRIIIYKSAWNSQTSTGQFTWSQLPHPGCDVGTGTGWTGVLGSGSCFVSPNGHFELLLQSDGNMVIYDLGATPPAALWSTNTTVSPADPGFAMRTLYRYDPLGNLTCVEQHGDSPAGPHGDGTAGTGCSASPSSDAASTWRVRRFIYDSLSHLLTAKNPESGTINYVYDNDGNPLQKTSPAPNAAQGSTATQTISYCYDELHRITGRAFGVLSCPLTSPVVSFSYDSGANAKGKLTQMTDQAGTATYTYDSLGRLSTETRSIVGVSKSTSYTYDLGSTVKTLTYPSGRVVTYAPDSAGRLVSALDGNGTNYVISASYNPDGSVKSLLNGSTPALNSSFRYNPRLQLCRITTLTSGTLPTSCVDSQHVGNVMDRGYDFHVGNGTAGSGTDNGNVIAIVNYRDTSRSQSFNYDALNRLTSGWTSANTGNYSWGENYSIDAWGNLQISPMSSKAHGGTFLLSGDAQNRPTGLAYDAAGNLLSYLSASYTYDQENNLSSTAGISYAYDGNGERVLKSNPSTGAAVKRYWSTGGNTLAEGDGSGNLTAEYIYFGSKRIARIDLSTNTVHYFLSDHLGSTSMVINATGVPEEESDFYPFGTEVVVTGPGANELKFTGKRRDLESQLDYFGARYYLNSFGRWLSPDWSRNPVSIPYADLNDPRSLNQYGIVNGNPTGRADLDGHKVEYLQQKQTAEEANKRVLGNVSKTERGLFHLEQNQDTKRFELKLDAKAAANFKGEHTEGYERLVKAINSDKTALVSIQSTIRLTDEAGSRMFDVSKDLGGGVTQYLGNGDVLVVLAPDGNKSAEPDMQHTLGPGGTKMPDPLNIIAGHELLGHGLGWMTTTNFSEPSAIDVEKQLRQEQHISPRVP